MTGAIIQARTGSSRFADKVFVEIGGVPLLQLVIERCRRAQRLDQVLVATTKSSKDDRIVAMCRSLHVPVFRGSEDDVLGRFAGAAIQFSVDVVVRVTADDPFKDPDIIDHAVKLLESDQTVDYVSNTIRPTYPEGMDIEVFRSQALLRADREARLASEREHVTPFIWKNSDEFNVRNFEAETNYSHLRWTIDYPQDYMMMNKILHLSAKSSVDVRLQDLLNVVEQHPELASHNSYAVRNEGYLKSLQQEQEDAHK